MKEYPITEDVLENIATLRNTASAAFAIGSLALGFAFSTFQSLSLAGDTVSDATKARWNAYEIMTLIIAIASYAVGIFFTRKGSACLKRVKEETTHEE